MLSHQVVYVAAKGADISFKFVPQSDEATTEERKQGVMERTFTVTDSYYDGKRLWRRVRTKKFAV